MPPDRAERVAEIVEAALERETRDCGAFVEQSCADDLALRREVESLLGYRREARTFIEQPAFEANADLLAEPGELETGGAIDGYEIISLLGEGGMGEVYLARDLSLGRKVALKLVKRGYGGRDLIRHFQHEERILAGLTHPNIARLYGAAVSGRGVPYFVMEYVEGHPLDEFCDQRQLSIAERLRLFRKICGAVAYAHQRLVIHRDLKPANIRVTPDGEPKLLDFGIAKLLDEGSDSLGQTMTLQGMMTPEYASPEQVRGETMTTASDVYSLGVVLYELLSGRKPYHLATRRPDEVARAITSQVPPRPSQAITSRALQLPPPTEPIDLRRARLLRGDLDNIAMMAIRKEPERRYASVAQFSEDIRRHLDGLPVIARKDTAGYRASKFIRRHKAGVVAVVLIGLTLVGGIVATMRQAQIARVERARAERRFNDVRKLANSVVFELHDAIESLPGSTAARALLVRRALEYLDSLAHESSSDASLQSELAAAYMKVGNVQGNPTNANLGDSAGALESYRKSLAITERLLQQKNEPASRHARAMTMRKVADVLANTNRVADAVQIARESLAMFKELADAASGEKDPQLVVAIGHLKLADILGNPSFVNSGDAQGAIENYEAALRIVTAVQARDAADPKTRRYLGVIHERMGTMRELQNETAAALAEYQSSAAIRVPLAAEFPNDAAMVRDAAIAYEKLGITTAAAGDLAASFENRRKALEIFERLVAADPQDAQARQSLAISHIYLGDLLGNPGAPNLGRVAEARQHYERAIELLEIVTRTDAANAATQSNLAEVRTKLEKLPSDGG